MNYYPLNKHYYVANANVDFSKVPYHEGLLFQLNIIDLT